PESNRILLIDDDDKILRSLQRLLKNEGYEIHTATRAGDAISMLSKDRFALVLTDQLMPEMLGTELLEIIEQQWPDTIRIILTGYSEIDTIIDAINKGHIFRFVSKPWDDDRLKLDIKIAVDQYRLKMENSLMAERIRRQNDKLIQLNNQLAQHFWDVSTGMTRIHDLLDILDVAVIVIDTDGMIIEANDKVGEYFNLDNAGYIGTMAQNILPELLTTDTNNPKPQQGTLIFNGRHLQWRKRKVIRHHELVSQLITIWEEI
ncbi:MAG: response regulator, partial [Sedimentisphaerales bacterium]|nr:response regulator [Sedimentisphaerales bacterium]